MFMNHLPAQPRKNKRNLSFFAGDIGGASDVGSSRSRMGAKTAAVVAPLVDVNKRP